jgi:ABC-2 type transport system permease protein
MKKLLIIGWKDFTVVWRDRAALILMLAAPFVLTLGLGFVSGRFSGDDNSGLRDIRLLLVNQDDGPLGMALVDSFASPDLAGLVLSTTTSDPAAARQQVEDDQAAAAILIPAGFSAGFIPGPDGETGPAISLEVYTNPGRAVSAGVVRAIVESFVSQAETAQVGGEVAIRQLLEHGLITPQAPAAEAAAIAARVTAAQDSGPLLTLARSGADASSAAPDFDVLAVFAPGMAMMFLMYTVSNGGRNLLAERSDGTLPRLLTTPTRAAQVLGGKVFGIFLTGAVQVAILVGASTTLFQLHWGNGLGVAALILAVAAAATGWGILLAAFARTPAQVISVGSALMLLFGIFGGIFIPLSALPGWLQIAARLSPNAWGSEAFAALARGGTLADIAPGLAALLVMAAALFAVAVLVFRRTSRA